MASLAIYIQDQWRHANGSKTARFNTAHMAGLRVSCLTIQPIEYQSIKQ